MNRHFRKFFYSTISMINRVIPKKNRIVIYSGKILDDNSEAIFNYLANNTNYPIICLADNISKSLYNESKTIIRKTPSYFNAIKFIFTSKILIDSSYHPVKIKPTPTQLFVNCWHGSPLKKLEPDEFIKNGQYYSLFFYSSDLFKNHLKKYFCVSDKKMLLNGNPRNDFLFDNTKVINDERKKVFWLPTFRQGLNRDDSSVSIPIITRNNIDLLDKYLEGKNTILYIKPHRLQKSSFRSIVGDNCKNIRILSDRQLMKKGIPLYRLLGQMDALLTDYSSVYFDYLLLNRPIGFVIDDFEEYKANRGFAFDDPLSLMPGAKIYTFDDLLKFFYDLSNGADDYFDERKRLNDLCNYYKDNSNCKRCFELIEKHIRS